MCTNNCESSQYTPHVHTFNTEIRMTLHQHRRVFNAKVKRIVRSLLNTSIEFSNAPENVGIKVISDITNSIHPLFQRLFWGFVLLVCIIICTYEVQDRVSYYISEPIVVDVTIEEEPNMKFPSVTLVSPETAAITDLLQRHNATFNSEQCINPIITALHLVKGLDVDKLWTSLDLMPSLELTAVITPKHQYNVSGKHEVGLAGSQLRFEPDQNISYNSNNKFTLQIRSQNPSCKSGLVMITTQSHGMPTNMKSSITMVKLTTTDLLITVNKFVFRNRRSQRCTNNARYLECWRQCIVDHFTDIPCRFPFLPKEIKKSSCISGPGMGIVYVQAMMSSLTLSCHCQKRCQETVFNTIVRYVQKNENNTVVNIYMVTNRVTIVTERFEYDITSLLSDIGGMLGLCLGLSILSIVEVFQNLVSFVVKALQNKNKNFLIFHGDPVLSITKRILSEELNRYRNKKRLSKTNSTTALWCLQVVLSIVLVSCVVISCLFMGVRIFKYLSEPTHMKVQIAYKDSVHFPNIIICSLSKPIISRLKKLANQTEDWCNFQLVDLLDDPTTSAEFLWKESGMHNGPEKFIELAKILFNKTVLENVSVQEVTLPDGICAEIHIGEQLFSGSVTKYTTGFNSSAVYEFEKELIKCGRQYHEIFITPPNELFNFNTRLLFPPALRTSLTLFSKEVTLLNTRRSPCVARELAKECHIRCFESKLLKHISCRLPYMPSVMNNLTTCKTVQSGKQAQAIYMTQAITVDSLKYKDCGCIKSCESLIITSAMVFEPQIFSNLTVFDMGFFNNIYEHIGEVAADNISILLCDIGGNLGLMLGISVLSLFDMIQSLLGKLQLKFKYRNK